MRLLHMSCYAGVSESVRRRSESSRETLPRGNDSARRTFNTKLSCQAAGSSPSHRRRQPPTASHGSADGRIVLGSSKRSMCREVDGSRARNVRRRRTLPSQLSVYLDGVVSHKSLEDSCCNSIGKSSLVNWIGCSFSSFKHEAA